MLGPSLIMLELCHLLDPGGSEYQCVMATISLELKLDIGYNGLSIFHSSRCKKKKRCNQSIPVFSLATDHSIRSRVKHGIVDYIFFSCSQNKT
jgi:hypothetical protein